MARRKTRQSRVERFAEDFWDALPPGGLGSRPQPKAKIFRWLERKKHWSRKECNNYYSDAVLWLAAKGRYIYIQLGREGGIKKAENAEQGAVRWAHSRKVIKGQRKRTNEYGSCLADDGVREITSIEITEQVMLPSSG